MMTKGRNCTYNKTEATEDIGFGHPAVTFKQLAQRFACCSVADVSDEYLRRSHSDNDNVIEVFFTKQLLLEENKTSIQFKCWLPSVVWRCWLSGRKGIRPAKKMSGEVLALLSVWSEVQMICIWSSSFYCHPSSLAPVKSRMVYLSSAGLPRLSWKKGH